MRLALAALAALVNLSAHAAPPPPASSGASVEYVVSGSSGGFEVTVCPDFVTVFYLPEDVTQAFASDQKNFTISIKKNTVAVRPLRAPLTANLNVDTKTLHVGVVMRTGPSERARSQVIFRTEEESRRFEAEVARRLEPIKAEYEEKMALQLARRVAQGLLAQFQVKALDGIARTDDNVIVRVTRAIWVGDDLYLAFRVQNRGGHDYALAAAEVRQGPEVRRSTALFQPAAPDENQLGLVAAGHEGTGIVILETRALKPVVPLELRLTDSHGAVLPIDNLRVE
jgi:hypothetical protein